MTHELTFEQIQKSKKAFDKFKYETNTGDEGFMSVDTLLNALVTLEFDIGQDEIQDIKKNMNLGSDIDFSTFLRITAIKFKQQELAKELENAFKAFDKHNNGYLSYKELRSIITENGPNLSIDEANELLKELGLLDDISNKNFYYKSFVSDTI
jgi:calmodulin